MKKITSFTAGLLALAFSSTTFAQKTEYRITDLNFAAPTVAVAPTTDDTRVGSIVYDLSTETFRGYFANGTWQNVGSDNRVPLPPTIQTFKTPGTLTYTTPANVLYIRVRMVGGGGGGSGSSGGAGNGGTGQQSTFGGTLLVANGGLGGAYAGTGGFGGTATISTGAYGTSLAGGAGASTSQVNGAAGGTGGNTAFGGSGTGAINASAAPTGGQPNTGSGGGGGTGVTTSLGGTGGGAAGFIDAIVPTPAASYTVVVGDGGAGGSTGSPGTGGAKGGTGYVEVTEYYQ